MAEVNRDSYRAAHERVATGRWKVDPIRGLVCGPRGWALRKQNSAGYIQIRFMHAGMERSVLAHRLVWEHVHGALPDGLEINHLNGRKADNRLENLDAVTAQENVRHAYRTGLTMPSRGEQRYNARLTPDQVVDIYRRAWAGENQGQLGSEYSVCSSLICRIKQGTAWVHVTGHHRAAA